VAFGAPRFPFSGAALATGESEDVALGVGDSLGFGVGVSLGSGVGEAFFFGFAIGDVPGDGATDFFVAGGLGEGDDDFFFVVADFFFLCGVGVGVGVEKIFLIFSATDCAANGGEGAKNAIAKIVIAAKRNNASMFPR
jgi:hypothetical protein